MNTRYVNLYLDPHNQTIITGGEFYRKKETAEKVEYSYFKKLKTVEVKLTENELIFLGEDE